jgi:hypothetical protein
MTDRNEKRGERRRDQTDLDQRPEPQEEARPNRAQSVDNRGRDVGRNGSESNPS